MYFCFLCCLCFAGCWVEVGQLGAEPEAEA